MVRAVRKRQQRRYVRRDSSYSLHGRRRRRVRAPLLLLAVALFAGLAVAAGVMAAATGSRHDATGPPIQTHDEPVPGAPGAHRPGSRQAGRRDRRAVAAVLRYAPTIAAGSRRRRVVALTFDDGPSPYTPEVLRVLERLRVPATFFVVGQQLRYFSEALREEVRLGFQIGDHTENHAWLIRLGRGAQYAQIEQQVAAVRALGAPTPTLFRPPYGAHNATTAQILRRLGMLMVLWSVDPGDWRRPGVKAIVSSVLTAAHSGSIVILHDGGGDRSQTVAALPRIVRGLRRRGYELVSVPQLLVLDPPSRHQRLPHLGAA